MQENTESCRICLDGSGELIQVCACTSKVHLACLNKWRVGDNPEHPRQECEICHSSYTVPAPVYKKSVCECVCDNLTNALRKHYVIYALISIISVLGIVQICTKTVWRLDLNIYQILVLTWITVALFLLIWGIASGIIRTVLYPQARYGCVTVFGISLLSSVLILASIALARLSLTLSIMCILIIGHYQILLFLDMFNISGLRIGVVYNTRIRPSAPSETELTNIEEVAVEEAVV